MRAREFQILPGAHHLLCWPQHSSQHRTLGVQVGQDPCDASQQIAAKKGALPGSHISVEDPAQRAAGQQNVADRGDQERGSASLSLSRL